jgi:uncharacterized protein
MNTKTQNYINKLKLIDHPEGGFYREVYRSEMVLKNVNGQERNISTSIYYLLSDGAFSAFHRIKSDESWHYYDGEGFLEILVLDDGKLEILRLGLDISTGERPQQMVPAGKWFAARLNNPDGFVLAGCTVAPGFDFQDFEMARKQDLLRAYPEHKELIAKYCLD